ncbi:MAG TPA: EI24 domain-containing protein [bacterium]|nr:EI24 domain-containing protein [bacterium]
MKRLTDGFFTAFRGLSYLAGNSSLWTLAVLPVLLNIVLFIGGIWAYVHFFPDLLGAIMDQPDAWYMWIVYVLLILLLVVAFALVVIFSFTLLGCIIAAPFLDLLSEKVERLLGRQGPERGLRGAIADMGNGVVMSLVTLTLFIVTQLALLLLWLVPVVGQIVYAVLSPLAGGLFFGAEFFDFPLGHRDLTAARRWAFVREHLPEAIGFGLAVFMTTLVPLLNFLMLPAATVGATLLVDRLEKEKAPDAPHAG